MQAESFKVLQQAQVPAVQAHALCRAIEIEIAGALGGLATKQDIQELRGDIETKTAELRGNLDTRIAELRGELRVEIHATADRTTRQLYGVTLTLMSTLAGIFYFLLTHAVR
jgi:hypothetical protein